MVGDRLSVVGNVFETYCFTTLKPTAVVPVGVALPIPVTVDVGSIGENVSDADNRKYESVLIHLAAVVVSDSLALGKDGKPHYIMVGKDANDHALRIGWGFGSFMQDKNGSPKGSNRNNPTEFFLLEP